MFTIWPNNVDNSTSLRRDNVAVLAEKREIRISSKGPFMMCPVPAYTDENWDILAEIIRTTTSLLWLCFDHRTTTALQNDKVVDALAKNCTIKTLNLWAAFAGDEGAKAVAAILKENSTIEFIRLDHNGIGVEGGKAIADALKKNTSLQGLRLSVNQIGVAGAEAIAEALKLFLSGNSIGVEGAKAIADSLKENASLRELHIGRNNIGDEGAKAIAEALKENASLQRYTFNVTILVKRGIERSGIENINLYMNNISEKTLKKIEEEVARIQFQSAIENIDLRGNQISEETHAKMKQEILSIQKFFKSAGSNEGQVAAIETAEDGGKGDKNASSINEDEGLPSIHATNAPQVDDWSVDGQQSNETEHDTTVTETKISQDNGSAENNQESNETETIQKGKEIATVMMERSQTMHEMLYIIDSTDALRTENIATLANARGIEIVGKGSPAYTDENWDILADVIRTTTSLEQLFFFGTTVIALQNKKVIYALVKNRTIKTLSLFWGGCNDKGAKVVAAILKENSTIEMLNLYRNKITGGGAKAIADALKHNKTLRCIDLNHNEIGDEGAKAFAGVLKEKMNLRIINLNSNQIGNEGAKAIAEALQDNTSLQTLFIERNSIGKKGGKDILKHLQQIEASTIESIYLQGNSMANKTMEEINQEMVGINNRFRVVSANGHAAAAVRLPFQETNNEACHNTTGVEVEELKSTITQLQSKIAEQEKELTSTKDILKKIGNLANGKDGGPTSNAGKSSMPDRETELQSEIDSLKEQLKNSRPIDTVDLTNEIEPASSSGGEDSNEEEPPSKRRRTKSNLAVALEQTQQIVQVKEEANERAAAAEANVAAARREKNAVEASLRDVQEDLEDSNELVTQQTLTTDIWQGRFDELLGLAEAAGVDGNTLSEIRYRPLSSRR